MNLGKPSRRWIVWLEPWICFPRSWARLPPLALPWCFRAAMYVPLRISPCSSESSNPKPKAKGPKAELARDKPEIEGRETYIQPLRENLSNSSPVKIRFHLHFHLTSFISHLFYNPSIESIQEVFYATKHLRNKVGYF